MLKKRLFILIRDEKIKDFKRLLNLNLLFTSKNKLLNSYGKGSYSDITLLCFASMVGSYEIVKLLLERGADPNLRASDGSTPLIYASQDGWLLVVQQLLNFGADVSLEKNIIESYTATQIAEKNGNVKVRNVLIQNGGIL